MITTILTGTLERRYPILIQYRRLVVCGAAFAAIAAAGVGGGGGSDHHETAEGRGAADDDGGYEERHVRYGYTTAGVLSSVSLACAGSVRATVFRVARRRTDCRRGRVSLGKSSGRFSGGGLRPDERWIPERRRARCRNVFSDGYDGQTSRFVATSSARAHYVSADRRN